MRPFIVEFLGTPEAGKTTSVKMLRRSLEEKGYKVGLVRESAEIVPDMFKTGSSKGNILMTLKTAQKLYEEINNDRDIVLVDRGIVDSLAWNYLYAKRGEFSEEKSKCVENFFEAIGVKTDFIVALTIPTEESIRRRGGEGHVVNRKFFEEFNREIIGNFLKSVEIDKVLLNTESKTPVEVHDWLLGAIEESYAKFKENNASKEEE